MRSDKHDSFLDAAGMHRCGIFFVWSGFLKGYGLQDLLSTRDIDGVLAALRYIRGIGIETG